MTWANGDTYTGTFDNNTMNGHGRYYSKQHNITYEGNYAKGIRHGKGKLYGDEQDLIG